MVYPEGDNVEVEKPFIPFIDAAEAKTCDDRCPGEETAMLGGGLVACASSLGGGGGNGLAALLASFHDDGIGAVEERRIPLPTEEEEGGAANVPLREAVALLLLLPLLTVILLWPWTGLGGSFFGNGGGLLSMNLRNSYFARMNLSSSPSLSESSMLAGGRLRRSSGL